MRLRLLFLLLALWSPARTLAAQEGELRVDINIPANRLVVFEGDREIRRYPISVGLPGHNTPTGSFKISRAEWNPWWRPPEREWAKDDKDTPPGPNNPMGRVKLFFLPLYFIHGTPDSGNIGQAASHGCVRMLNTDVVALARLIHSRAAPQVTNAQIDRFLAASRTTRTVAFRDSVSLTIRYDPIEVRNDTVHVYPNIYGYNAVHSEAVYQALIAAGYSITGIRSADVQRLLTRARTTKTAFSLPVSQAFVGGLTRAEGRVAVSR
jgi:murein L,D-transpeptidase YcbB/YkuD